MKKQSLILLAAMAFYACQPESIYDEGSEKSAKVHVRVGTFDFLPFETRTAMSVSDVSTRLSYAFFKMNGEKAMNTKSQVSTDNGFGTFDVSLAPNQYILVTVAHNGAGNCTITSPTEVTFSNNLMTDTFTSCDTLDLSAGEQSIDVQVARKVAMVRIVLDEVLPQEVTQMKLYYTGGSSTLDPSTGFGCKNSRQTEYRNVPASAHETKGSVYEVYTLPHTPQDELKLTITALNSAGSALTELSINQVPVRVGEISQYRGTLFGGGGTNGKGVEVKVDYKDWKTNEYQF